MKKFICIMISCVLYTVVVGGIFYQIGYGNAKKEKEYNAENNISVDEGIGHEGIGQLDYPLIDIAFNDGNEYAVVICDGIYSEKQTYLWCRDRRNLQFNTEHLYIRTYPLGRGTTGNGAITIYRNGEEIRYIEFLEIHFTSEEMKNSFVKVSSNELNDYLNAK